MTYARNFEAALVKAYSLRYILLYISAMLWLPFSSAFASQAAQNTPFVSAITMYKAEALILASLFMLALGVVAAMRYEPPIDVPESIRMDITTKFLFAVAGGIAAFIYVLDQQKTLTILHPVWVFGVSVVTPSFVQVAFPIVVKVWYKFVKSKSGDSQ